jgi:beta-glucanase (GH16 family)
MRNNLAFQTFSRQFLFLSIILIMAACSPAVVPSPTPVPTLLPTDTPAPTSAPTLTPTTLPWKLVWSDEFDGLTGSAPDPKKWTYNVGGEGWGNQEHEYYTDKTGNAALDGSGALVITALKIDDPAGGSLKCWYGPCKYTSARLLTKGLYEFTYGRVEARIKIPFGQGIWPAFWMLGNDIDTANWPKCGEIDILENIGKEPSIAHGTLHGPGYSGGSSIGAGYTLDKGKFADDFHVYSIEWEKDVIRWYIDGNLYHTVTPKKLYGAEWVFDHPFFIILNVAVGGSWPGYPDDTTTFPQTMGVDYVRVYQH